MAYRLLENAGCVPPELALRKAVADAERRLAVAEDAEERERARRRLLDLWRILSVSHRSAKSLHLEALTYSRLVERLARGREQAD